MNHSFSDLALLEPIQRALRAANYERPTPIQAQAIPHLLAGRDLVGIAQTGTGKTAAFALPILNRLSAAPAPVGRGFVRALVLTPTRELAIQIDESFRSYGRYLALRHAVIYGGINQRRQVAALSRGLDILVATPGRLLDLMGQGHVRLERLSIFVLDEADRMLDMGFIHDVKKIIAALPKARQSLFFSATMPPEIGRLAASILSNPARVEVTPAASTVERVEQRVLFVDAARKRALLAELLKDPAITRALVFTRTKHGANRLAEQLERIGVQAEAIHGNKSQPARQRALDGFRCGATRVLVATDIAARGIDIDGISHVINYELPNVPESYVHRIGRTARAGADGTAISFCDGTERAYLKDIERLTRRPIAVVEDHPFHAPARSGVVDAERGPRAEPAGRARPGRGQPWQRPAFARPQRRGLMHNSERS
ncbi:MAG TPA: DEAD/DEAH box helicase [Alphaproteobacteria bacterium]|nr:DEAD/DEAH box helicase [Alphaproteobacteria bacterium]